MTSCSLRRNKKNYCCFPVSHQDNSRLNLELPVIIYNYFVLVGLLCCFSCFCWIHYLAELQPVRQGKGRRKGNFGRNLYLQNSALKILVNSALLLLWTLFVLWSLPRVKRSAHKEKWDPLLLHKDLLLPVPTADLKPPKKKFKNVLGSGRTPWPWNSLLEGESQCLHLWKAGSEPGGGRC